jgi:alanine racemase
MVASWPLPSDPMPSRDGTPRVLKPRRAAPADAVRPTRAEVNLGNVRRNLHAVKRIAGSAGVLGVLKADAYGHGAPAIARTLERAGIDGIAVALLEEAIELRDAGITCPVLVMGGYYGQAWGELLAADVTPVIYDAGQIEGLSRAARFAGHGPTKVHLKLDTGMSRLGVRENELSSVLDAFRRFPDVVLHGLMTHFACAESHDATMEQNARFEAMSAVVRAAGFSPAVRHAANSAALLGGEARGLELVRPGIALFGVLPPGVAGPELHPVMKVRSEIAAIRDLAAGESAGYGWTFRAERPTRLATVPIGYADGLPRSLSNKGSLLVRGKRAPIAGTVSMDMVMIDVTEVPGATVRDEVVALGAQQGPLGKDAITAEEIASLAGTIAWEVLTSISRRVPRFYREP